MNPIVLVDSDKLINSDQVLEQQLKVIPVNYQKNPLRNNCSNDQN